MLTHEFVLCAIIPTEINYSDYSKDDMVIVSDDFILENNIHIDKVKMHCQYLGNMINGLDYYGITIIPPDTAKELKKELLGQCQDSCDLRKLINVLDKAIESQCYVIHFGI